MKEEAKKSTTKKTSTTKSTASKKTTTKSSGAKKTAPKKTIAPKKTTTTKKVTSNKSNTTKKVTPKKVEEKVIEKEIIKDDALNKELVMRSILIMSYTIIIVILIIGFVDSLINPPHVQVEEKVVPYITTEEVLQNSNIIDIEDANFKLSALQGNYFVYISYTDASINDFEKDLVKLLDQYNLRNDFYYINVDSVKDEENSIELINKYLNYNDVKITKIPTIVYVNNDGIVRSENIITRDDNKLITIGDFQKLLDINQF